MRTSACWRLGTYDGVEAQCDCKTVGGKSVGEELRFQNFVTPFSTFIPTLK